MKHIQNKYKTETETKTYNSFYNSIKLQHNKMHHVKMQHNKMPHSKRQHSKMHCLRAEARVHTCMLCDKCPRARVLCEKPRMCSFLWCRSVSHMVARTRDRHRTVSASQARGVTYSMLRKRHGTVSAHVLKSRAMLCMRWRARSFSIDA